MSRFYPRNIQARRDAVVGQSNFHGHHADAERREDAQNPLFGTGPTTIVSLNNSLSAADIKSGGILSAPIYTIGGSDRFVGDLLSDANKAAALIAGFPPASVLSLTAANLSVDASRTVLTMSLSANSAFVTSINTAYNWTFPKGAFENARDAVLAAPAFNVRT